MRIEHREKVCGADGMDMVGRCVVCGNERCRSLDQRTREQVTYVDERHGMFSVLHVVW